MGTAVPSLDVRMWDSAQFWVSLRADRIARGAPAADVQVCEEWLRYLGNVELQACAFRVGRPELAPRARCPRMC
jgi:hypothetical protein